ncbi:hypothetical protein GLOIN_2v1771287 [Rhizophagus irregularis DAOM 181602=DAOM 197198]|nr:hypothetical protein GLOIN_2v1771287 [Rhizophagus irregularis DAOM 181602=DAOM 197198]
MGYNNELIINEDFDTSYNDSTQPFTGSLAGQKCARLINVYLLADQSKDKDLTIELYNYIENTIKTRKQNKYKITIMRFQHRFRQDVLKFHQRKPYDVLQGIEQGEVINQQINFNTSVVGYLDDTSWYAPSLEKLKLANEFYELANITINHDKYEILTNDKKRCNKEITLQVTHQKSIKVTTVYINAFHTHGPNLSLPKSTYDKYHT